MSELLLGDEDIKEGDGKWPVEVVVAVETGGVITVLNRDSYKELSSVKPVEDMDTGPTGKEFSIDGTIVKFLIIHQWCI